MREDELQHYGVKGMKWGVRRARARADSYYRKYGTRKAALAQTSKDRKRVNRALVGVGSASAAIKAASFIRAAVMIPTATSMLTPLGISTLAGIAATTAATALTHKHFNTSMDQVERSLKTNDFRKKDD